MRLAVRRGMVRRKRKSASVVGVKYAQDWVRQIRIISSQSWIPESKGHQTRALGLVHLLRCNKTVLVGSCLGTKNVRLLVDLTYNNSTLLAASCFTALKCPLHSLLHVLDLVCRSMTWRSLTRVVNTRRDQITSESDMQQSPLQCQ